MTTPQDLSQCDKKKLCMRLSKPPLYFQNPGPPSIVSSAHTGFDRRQRTPVLALCSARKMTGGGGPHSVHMSPASQARPLPGTWDLNCVRRVPARSLDTPSPRRPAPATPFLRFPAPQRNPGLPGPGPSKTRPLLGFAASSTLSRPTSPNDPNLPPRETPHPD